MPDLRSFCGHHVCKSVDQYDIIIEELKKTEDPDGFFPISIYEWEDYIIDIHYEKDTQDNPAKDFRINAKNFNTIAKELYKDDSNGIVRYSLRYENFIGKSCISINDKKYNFEVSSKKLELVGGYKIFYKNLLTALYKEISSLPYSENDSLIYERVGPGDTESRKFFEKIFFKYNYDLIEEALNTIVNIPHKKQIEEESIISIESVNSLENDSLLQVLQNPEHLVKSKKLKLGDYEYFPEKVFAYIFNETYDTPENRFVKYFITLMVKSIQTMIDASEYADNKYLVLFKEILSANIFLEVSEVEEVPYYSTVLQKRMGYAELFRLYNEFLFSYKPEFNDIYKAIDNHNIDIMYEWFCFFELSKRLSGNAAHYYFVRDIHANKLCDNSYSEFAFNNENYKLYYNRTFSHHTGSYSVTLRPDFSLFYCTSKSEEKLLGVFDAKFRLEASTIQAMERNDEKYNDFETTAKKADIYKMHTYRDALVDCEFAIICYPGDNQEGFYKTGKKNEDINMSILTNLYPNYEINFSGITYYSIHPCHIKI